MSERVFTQTTALLTASRIAQQLPEKMQKAIVETSLTLSKTENMLLADAVSICFRYFCRENDAVASFIYDKITDFESSESYAERYIFREVETERFF